MSDKNEKNEAIEYFLKIAEVQGAACATVKDGHVLLFKRSFLQEILNKNQDQEKIMIFVQRPDFKN